MKSVRMYHDPLDPTREVSTRDPWISQGAYGEVVQKMPIPCTDSVFTVQNDNALYLAMRSVYPMKGIWCFGGRISFNDRSLEEAVARCIDLETGYRIPVERFEFVVTHYYTWVKTAQGDFGGKNLAVTFNCKVTPSELDLMRSGLVASEYDRSFGIQRFDRKRLKDENAHPAMLDIFDDLFK
ncbi:hypothetical protein JNK62_03370 [bacterium]|nr:hypothetical protein [bacterium]